MSTFGFILALIFIALVFNAIYQSNKKAEFEQAVNKYIDLLNPDSDVLPLTDNPDHDIMLYRNPVDDPRYIRFNIPYPDNYKRVAAGSIPVAGTYYRADEVAHWLVNDPAGIELEADPYNEHDKNAIKVYGYNYSKDGIKKLRHHIGFIPAEEADDIAKKGIKVDAVPVKIQAHNNMGEVNKIYITLLEM